MPDTGNDCMTRIPLRPASARYLPQSTGALVQPQSVDSECTGVQPQYYIMCTQVQSSYRAGHKLGVSGVYRDIDITRREYFGDDNIRGKKLEATNTC